MNESRGSSIAVRLCPWGMIAVVFGLVLAVYWPALRGGLVWDDKAHVTPPELQGWPGLARIWCEPGATQQYYPVLHSVFWAEHRLWGDATAGYHLANAAWHATACCLLALVLRRLRRLAGPPAPAAAGGMPAGTEWLAAVIFAVHPVCVESVAWISEQKNTLSLVFYLLAALAYLDFEATRRGRVYGAATVLFLLALGTKTVTATLPAALLVGLWWRDGRLAWRNQVWPLVPWFLVAATAGLFTVWVERNLIGAEGVRFELGWLERVLLAARVIWFYLGKWVCPTDLMFIYPRWEVATEASAWFAWLAGAIGVTAGLWAWRKRARGPLAAWLFFVGSLFPALGFCNVYPFVFSFVADHFQYLASLGLAAAAAAGGAGIFARATPAGRRAALGLGAAAVIALAFLANRQSRDYRSSMALYRATLARNPGCWMAHTNLANELALGPGHELEVMDHLRQALWLAPDYPEIHNDLATQLASRPGQEAAAIAHFRAALRLRPDYPAATSNLANLLSRLPGREAEAVALCHEALRRRPGDPILHYDLASVLARLPGRDTEAIVEFENALRLKPDYPDAHYNLANALARLPGHELEAEDHYRAAARNRPDFAEAENNLGITLARQPGREAEAEEHFRKALRAKPDVADIHCNLAALLAKEPGREVEAAELYEQALSLRPDDPRTHNNLAVIYVRQGRIDAAREHWRRALELDPDYAVARRNLDLL